MAVKEGYKLTEVGVIPEDWECLQLGDIGKSIIGLTYKPSDVSDWGTLVLRSSNIDENVLKFDDNVFVDVSISEDLITRKGDILICVRNGSRDLIGKCAIIEEDSEGHTFGAFMSIFRSNMGQYLLNVFQSDILKKQINRHLGATINQITNRSLNSFYVPLPESKKEQKAIATALSDIDGLINSLTKLIEKKKSIKQGVMQELLTGKKRLEGFSGEWIFVALYLIAKVTIGLVTTMTTNYVETGTLLIRNSDITPNKIKEKGLINLDNNFAEQNKARQFKLNDIVTVHTGDVGTSAVINKKMVGSIGFATLNTRLTNNKVNPNYLSTYFNSSLYKNQALEMVTGDGRNNLNLKDFEKSIIPLPPNIEEQTAIATILSDMDSEIESLQTKLEKYKAIKQGMMQELLTGRIRLLEGA